LLFQLKKKKNKPLNIFYLESFLIKFAANINVILIQSK